MFYRGGPFALEVMMGWLSSIHTAKKPWQLPIVNRKVKAGISHLPLAHLPEKTLILADNRFTGDGAVHLPPKHALQGLPGSHRAAWRPTARPRSGPSP